MTAPTPSRVPPTTDRPGVVVHIAEAAPERHEVILRNVTNLVGDLPDVPVEIVAHGPGMELYTGESGHVDALSSVAALGVGLLVCGNTLRARELTLDDLHEGVTTVPSGVGHLARRQLEGWAYLRP